MHGNWGAGGRRARAAGAAAALFGLIGLMGLTAACGGSGSRGSGATASPSAARSSAAATSAPETSAATPAAQQGKPSGVIFAALQDDDWIVVAVDPATGTASQVADFVPSDDDVRLDAEYVSLTDGGPLSQRELFSPDLERGVAVRRMPDNTTHVGWIDRAGAFTDVTEATASSGGFTSTTADDTPVFGPDGAFYFARREPDGSGYKTNPTIWRLTGSDPAAARALTKLKDINFYLDTPAQPKALCAGCVPFRTPAGQTRGAFRATGFVGTTSYLSTDPHGSMVYLSPLQKESATSLMDWGTDGKALIPQTNRTVWAPVADPQGTQVAFLSKAADATDPTIAPQLFTVPAKGGAPHEVTVGGDALGGKNPTLLGWM